METINFQEISHKLTPYIESIVLINSPGGKKQGNEYMAGNIHGGQGDSFRINLNTGKWADFATGEKGGDIISLYAKIKDIQNPDSARQLSELYLHNKPTISYPVVPPKSQTKIIKPPLNHKFDPPLYKQVKPNDIYIYRDHGGSVMFYICRYDYEENGKHVKMFTPWTFSDNGKWQPKAWPSPRPLYNLDKLHEFPDKAVLIVEGEKAANAAQKIVGNMYIVTTWPNGAQAYDKADWTAIYGRKVLLWPDADEPGHMAMSQIAARLVNNCMEVKYLNTNLPDGHDAADINMNWKQFKTWATPLVSITSEKLDVYVTEDISKSIAVGYNLFISNLISEANKPYYERTEKGFKPMYNDFSDLFKKSNTLKYCDRGWYIYDDNYWQPVSDAYINNVIDTINRQFIQPQHYDYFRKTLKSRCFDKAFTEDLPELNGLMNVKNGILDTKTGELAPHSSQYMFKQIIDVNYNPNATCPTWLKYLEDTFCQNQELIDLAQDILGYVLIGGNPFLHKAFILFGSGRNGKSTFIDVFRMLLGKSTSAVGIKLLDKPFSAVALDGKLANLVEETPSGEVNAESFKAAVGGGVLTAAHKGFDEFELRVTARFIFACNDLPTFDDKNESLMERLVIIPFNNYIPQEKRDTKILEKLKAELDGILAWAIVGAKRITQTRELNIPQISIEAKESFRNDNDKVYSWFNETVIVGTDMPNISSKDVYLKYVNDTEENGNKPLSRDKFLKRFKKELKSELNKIGVKFEEDYRFRDLNGTRQRGFNVFKFIDDGRQNNNYKPWEMKF